MERTELKSDIRAIENRENRLRPITVPSDMMDISVSYALAKHCHRAQFRKEIDPDSGEFIRYFEIIMHPHATPPYQNNNREVFLRLAGAEARRAQA
jgi:hypothetical protein